jgi:hypothetical protein
MTSNGTQNMIDLALEKDIPAVMIMVEPDSTEIKE